MEREEDEAAPAATNALGVYAVDSLLDVMRWRYVDAVGVAFKRYTIYFKFRSRPFECQIQHHRLYLVADTDDDTVNVYAKKHDSK